MCTSATDNSTRGILFTRQQLSATAGQSVQNPSMSQSTFGMMHLGLTSCLASLLLLAACVVGPRYARPSVEVPPAYKELPQQDAQTQGEWKIAQPKDGTIRGKWWDVFDDPRLDALEEQASASNQNIIAAAANFMSARALVRQARSQYFPTVSTNPNMAYARPSPGQLGGVTSSSSAITLKAYGEYELPFDASWEPDFWGRIRNTVRGNVYAAQASAADLENVCLSEQAELAADYYELRAQDSLIQILVSTVAAYQETFELTQSQYRAGLGSEEAVAQAEAQLKAAHAQEIDLGVQRAQYEHAIAVLTGQPASTFSLPAQPLQAKPPATLIGVPSELLERRPDIAAAERSVAQANAQIGVAKTAYFPAVLLSGSAGFANLSLSNWLTWPSRFWSVGPSIAETIFDAGLRRATVQQFRANYDLTVANYRQTVLTAFQQVEDNLASLEILSRAIGEQDAAVEAAARSLQEATVRYRAGIDPYLNVITAQTTLLNDQQTAVSFRMQEMVVSVQLIKALGGSWNAGQIPSSKEIRAQN